VPHVSYSGLVCCPLLCCPLRSLIFKAFKPPGVSCLIGFRRQPVDAAILGRESPAPPAAVEGRISIGSQTLTIAGLPEPSAPPCRLVRFDNLETPRLPNPLGPGSISISTTVTARQQQQQHCLQLRYSGFFVCGPRPVWLVATRGGVEAHPMQQADIGQVDAFCDFHNVNCPHGYIAAARDGKLNICTLPLQVRGSGAVVERAQHLAQQLDVVCVFVSVCVCVPS
jgi:cleavage and polyadenylation specificity factor subunit 1